MKITRVRAVVVLAIALSVAVLATVTRSRAVAASPPGPVLIVHMLSGGPASRSESPRSREDRAMALATASMTPAERAWVIEQLDYASTRLEARLSPVGADLEDDDPVEALRRSLRRYAPTFTAARELERGAWASVDLSVRVASSCADAKAGAGETCLSLWDASDGPPDLGRRARFLAWAASRAAVLDLGTPERVAECARVLRQATSTATSTIALVLTDEDLALRPTADRQVLQTSVRRLGTVMAASGRRDAKDLEVFATAHVEERVAPWLVIPPSALVVVPRLSAMADSAGLEREIEAAAGGRVRWLHAP